MIKFMFFVLCIVIQLYNVNQQNAHFCWLTLHNQMMKFKTKHSTEYLNLKVVK